MTPYLSICSCCGYDVTYLPEWIEFHRLVGVERFLLYNNGDRKAQRELLAPYVEAGTVVLHEWPINPPQMAAYEHCMRVHRDHSRWIAFIDTDEFLFSPTNRSLPDVLGDYVAWPGVGVCRALFGPSGRRTKPPGLVIESYLRRVLPGPEAPVGIQKGVDEHSRMIKSIVDPRRVARPLNPHRFIYREGLAVDENRQPLKSRFATSLSLERLRINHYYTRSEEEWALKLSRPRPDNSDRYDPRETVKLFVDLDRNFGVTDETITTYAPALRAALRPPPEVAATA